jgi:hypothetical protein
VILDVWDGVSLATEPLDDVLPYCFSILLHDLGQAPLGAWSLVGCLEVANELTAQLTLGLDRS